MKGNLPGGRSYCHRWNLGILGARGFRSLASLPSALLTFALLALSAGSPQTWVPLFLSPFHMLVPV